MRWTSVIRLRLRSLFSRKTVEQELDEELRYHFEREIDEGIAAGMTPQDARYAALQSIKDIEQRKEECRDMRGWNSIDNTRTGFSIRCPPASKKSRICLYCHISFGFGHRGDRRYF